MTRVCYLAVFASLFSACAGDGFSVPAENEPETPMAETCQPSDLQTVYADTDMDGYGDPANEVQDCEVPAGYVTNKADCNDNEPLAYEGATELCGDKVDNNCSGSDLCVPNLFGHWNFIETTGITTSDESGNLLSGTLKNGLVHGEGSMLAFDGDDDYIEVSDDLSLHLKVATISAWFMPTNDGGRQAILSKDSAGNDAGGHMTIYFENNSTVRVRLQSANNNYDISSNEELTLNQWHHVAFTYGGNEGMTLYVDDVEAGKDPYTQGMQNNKEPFVIGAGTSQSGDLTAEPINDPFAGKITEVQIYNRQLLRTELTSLKLLTDPRN